MAPVASLPSAPSSPSASSPSARDDTMPASASAPVPTLPHPDSIPRADEVGNSHAGDEAAEATVAPRSSPRLSSQRAARTAAPVLAQTPEAAPAAPTTPSGSKAAGKKKRKSRTDAPAPSSPVAGAPALKKSKRKVKVPTPATPGPAMTPATPASTTTRSPIDLSQEDESDGASPTSGASTAHRRPASRTTRDFDLSAFMRTFNGGEEPATTSLPATQSPPDPATSPMPTSSAAPVAPLAGGIQGQLALLQSLVLDMRARLDDQLPANQPMMLPAAQPTLAAELPVATNTTPPAWTLPAGRSNTMPPPAIIELRTASFPVPVRRIRGEYQPTPAHLLTAHRMFRWLSTDEGRAATPMSFLLSIRELRAVRFPTPPAVLMAIFSGQLGSRGLSILHFRRLSELQLLELGSSNANYNADFGAGAALPRISPKCEQYEHLIDAIQGLADFGHAVWFDHVQSLAIRLRQFVIDNSAVDQCNTPNRVTLTLLYVNRYLGAALGHLMEDSPYWWRNYHRALQAIEFNSIEWSMALNSLALEAPRLSSGPSMPGSSRTYEPRRASPGQHRGGQFPRPPPLPPALRQMIPRNERGEQPCLKFLAGGMCVGGTPDRCAFENRTHHWDEALPQELREFIDEHYAPRRRGPRPSRRA